MRNLLEDPQMTEKNEMKLRTLTGDQREQNKTEQAEMPPISNQTC